MLEHLEIRNFALIEDLSIDFETGLNVITGETGSGKTIILSALELIMGDKASDRYIRPGATELYVSALISIPNEDNLIMYLSELGIEPDDDKILIRRTIKTNLRSIITIQGVTVSRSELIKITEYVFDIHNQNEHQSLLKENSAINFLDTYAIEYNGLLRLCAEKYKRINELKTEIDNLTALSLEGEKQKDYLKYALNKIKIANITFENEDEELSDRLSTLTKMELIYDSVSNSINSLSSAVEKIYDSDIFLSKIKKYNLVLSSLNDRLNDIRINCDDLLIELKNYLNSLSYSESDVNNMQERLSELQKLKRKYGGINGKLKDVFDFKINAEKILNSTDDMEEKKSKYKCEYEKVLSEYNEVSKTLTEKRLKASREFSKKILDILKTLGMPNADFKTEVITSDDYMSALGKDKIVFKISANPGQELRPISEVASGGELSRIMLAIKTVHIIKENIQTQVFDEIDTGIGGLTAIKLADCLKNLSKKCQIILVTHLASIAGKADQQFVVSKEVINGNTFTKIKVVKGEERVYELSRMIGGDTAEISLDYVKHMLNGENNE